MVHRPPKKPVTYARRPRQKRKGDILNSLTGLLLLVSICLSVWFIYVFNLPDSLLNPFPPHGRPTSQATDSLPTAVQLAAVVSNTPTIPQQPTHTPQTQTVPTTGTSSPTQTPSLTFTISPVPFTATPAPKGFYSYKVIGVPPVTAIKASIMNQNRGCEWTGIGGNIMDIQHRPAPGIMVQLGGQISGNEVLKTSLSGVATQYGAAGYEFTLNIKPTNSQQGLWIRLVDEKMDPISEQIYFDTFNDCERNLVLINFQQVK